MTFISLPGPVAYSPFRINALINHINTSLNSSAVVVIRSVYVHYVDISPKSDILSTETAQKQDSMSKLDILKALLEYDTQPDEKDQLTQTLLAALSASTADSTALPENSYLLRVLPRPGTISPWSSKATNIAQVCGLGDDVERIERGIALIIQVRKGFPFDEHLKSGVFLDFIYDRMTQVSVFHFFFFFVRDHQSNS